jgi:hypothetical protein
MIRGADDANYSALYNLGDPSARILAVERATAFDVS